MGEGDFAIAAKMIAASIVQGGPAPHCFSAAVADFIVYGEVRSSVQLTDITDLDIRLKMEKVSLLWRRTLNYVSVIILCKKNVVEPGNKVTSSIIGRV